ncbi:hypothetical protein OKW29_007413 [Paraburkholderia sp. CI3]
MSSAATYTEDGGSIGWQLTTPCSVQSNSDASRERELTDHFLLLDSSIGIADGERPLPYCEMAY